MYLLMFNNPGHVKHGQYLTNPNYQRRLTKGTQIARKFETKKDALEAVQSMEQFTGKTSYLVPVNELHAFPTNRG